MRTKYDIYVFFLDLLKYNGFFLKIVKKSDLQIVEFLNELTEIMVGKVAKKPKCIQTIYAVLRLITKGITHRLCKGKHYCSLFLCK